MVQDLVMQGKLPPGRYGAARLNDEKEPIVREVVINDAPAQTRYNLTKRPVQDDIARRTNTLIVTRGRYYPPGLPQDEAEPPLRLKILPGGNLPPVSTAFFMLKDWAWPACFSMHEHRCRPAQMSQPQINQYWS